MQYIDMKVLVIKTSSPLYLSKFVNGKRQECEKSIPAMYVTHALGVKLLRTRCNWFLLTFLTRSINKKSHRSFNKRFMNFRLFFSK